MYKDLGIKQPRKLSAFQIFRFAVLGLILLLVIFGYQIAKIYTDWKWFHELNQSAVFSTLISAPPSSMLSSAGDCVKVWRGHTSLARRRMM